MPRPAETDRQAGGRPKVRPWAGRWVALFLCAWFATRAADAAASDLARDPDVATAITLLDLWIEEKLAYEALPSLVIGIVHDQELIWSKAYGLADIESKTPATLDTRYRAGSVTKVFTATAVMQLRDGGHLALDDPVGDHLPGFAVRNPWTEAPEITVRHLLTHTSGLPREGAFPYWTSHEFPTRAELLSSVANQALRSPPGDAYRYSNLGMALLGALVESLSGIEYATYVREQVLRPLSMSDSQVGIDPDDEGLATGYMRRTPNGARRRHDPYPTGALAPAAGLVVTLGDLANFASLHFRDEPPETQGESRSKDEVVRAASLRQMHRVQFLYPSWSGGMGLGFRVAQRQGKTTVSHGGWIGGHRSHLFMVPEEKIAVVALTNADDASPYPFSFEAYDAVGPALHTAARAPREAPPETPETWRSYAGLYSDPWGSEYRVLVLEGRLAMVGFDYPPAVQSRAGLSWLEPVDDGNDGRFRMSDGDPVIFEVDDLGRVFRVQRRYDYLFPLGADGLPQVTDEIPMPVTEDSLPGSHSP